MSFRAVVLLLPSLLACTQPERIPLDLSLDGLSVLVDDLGERGVRGARFEAQAGATWSRPDEAGTIELWAYQCAAGLPSKEQGWQPAPECLPPPLARRRYDPVARAWAAVPLGEASPLGTCDPCATRSVGVESFEIPVVEVRPEVGAALLLDERRALISVQDWAATAPWANAWYLIERGAAARPLRFDPGPRIGALRRLSDGRILAMGAELWRVQLEPDEARPERVTLLPWSATSSTIPELAARLSVVLEAPNGDLWLGSSHGALLRRRGEVLERFLPKRTNRKPLHPLTLALVGSEGRQSLLAVGVGANVDLIEDDTIEMNDYVLVDLDAAPTPTAVRSFPLGFNARAAASLPAASGRRGYVVDYGGEVHRVADNGASELVLERGQRGGPTVAIQDQLILMGPRGGVQTYTPRDVQECDAVLAGRAGILLAGEGVVLGIDFDAGSGAWLTPIACTDGAPE